MRHQIASVPDELFTWPTEEEPVEYHRRVRDMKRGFDKRLDFDFRIVTEAQRATPTISGRIGCHPRGDKTSVRLALNANRVDGTKGENDVSCVSRSTSGECATELKSLVQKGHAGSIPAPSILCKAVA